MSNPGTWCDNIIIQAVANANNCVIHITESDINKPEGTTITPVSHDQQPRVIFIGYINGVTLCFNCAIQKQLQQEEVSILKEQVITV